MTGHIFNLQDDGTLVEMNEQQYTNENIFQTLLEKYPNLLAGDQIDQKAPRRWLLIKREMGVPASESGSDQWSLDHLFLDQDAIPTLVEVKRSSDTRLRREVVAQMLDYAANGVKHWPLEKLVAEFEKQCDSEGITVDERLNDFLEEDIDPDAFWKAVKTNLQAGKIRLLFVADEIPNELRRIVEFLNEQMDPAEVLAVEIKQYVGSGLKTLVPRVIGQTAEAESRKAGSGGKRNRVLSELELQQIADERGVGILYRETVNQLKPLFEAFATSRSTIAFNCKVSGVKTKATLISLIPDHSTGKKGVRYGVHVDRVAEYFSLSSEQVIESLPNIDEASNNPEYSGQYRAGFADAENGLNEFIQLLK